MARRCAVIRVSVLLFSFLAVFVGVAAVQADTYTLEVNPLPGYGPGTVANLSTFWITYTDTGTDNLLGGLDSGESIIKWWSGVTDQSYVFPANYGFAMIPYVQDYVNGVGVDWGWNWGPQYPIFGTATADSRDFSYSREAGAVPVPPSALLLASGLIPLAWARRKKRLRK
ncbi:MAG: hypothetical protein ABSA09_08200 [Desulfobaccales bacterium]